MDASARREVQQPEGIIHLSRREVPQSGKLSPDIASFKSKGQRKEYGTNAKGTVDAHNSAQCKSSDRAVSSTDAVKTKVNGRQKKTLEMRETEPATNPKPANLRCKRKIQQIAETSPPQADNKKTSNGGKKIHNPKRPGKPLVTPPQPQRRSKRLRQTQEEAGILLADSKTAEAVSSPEMSFGGTSDRSVEFESPQAAAGSSSGVARSSHNTGQTALSVVAKTRKKKTVTRNQPQRQAKMIAVSSSIRRSTRIGAITVSKAVLTTRAKISAGKGGLGNPTAIPQGRKKPVKGKATEKAAENPAKKAPAGQKRQKKAPAATSTYSPKKQLELLGKMTRNCPYCDYVAKSRVEVKGHLLKECPTLQDTPEVKYILQNMLDKGVLAPKPNTYKYKACPMDGICYLANLQYPSGTIIAPHGWCYINFGFNKDKYGEGIIRFTCQAQEYRRKGGKMTRVRTYTDKSIHELWELKVRQLIQRDQIKELIIPVSFWFLRADVFKILKNKNHCAVIVMKISNGFVTEYKYYDSVQEDLYYNQAANQAVASAIQLKLQLKNRILLKKEEPYPSMVLDGCQGVQAYYLFQRFLNREINHPPNMETIQFWKCFLFNCPRSVDMKGEEFDRRWVFKTKVNRRTSDEDPEMETYLQDQYCKILGRSEFRDLDSFNVKSSLTQMY